jgi:hypothetical protein
LKLFEFTRENCFVWEGVIGFLLRDFDSNHEKEWREGALPHGKNLQGFASVFRTFNTWASSAMVNSSTTLAITMLPSFDPIAVKAARVSSGSHRT